MADSIHCVRKTLRLMPEEAKILSERAEDARMNEAEYIRLLIRQRPVDHREVRLLLKDLINETNRIGVNINQIVKNHNSALYSDKDKTQLAAYMRKLSEQVNEVVMRIGNQ
jgi:hypothetical protein